MKKKSIYVVLITSAVWMCVIGLVALNNGSVPWLNKDNKIYILKASRNIKVGSVIKASDLKKAIDKKTNLVSGSYTNEKFVIGKVASRNIYLNEQFTKDDVLNMNTSKLGLRPCTLPVNLSSLSDITISEGDYVDIIVNYKTKGKKPDIIVAKGLVTKIVDNYGQPLSAQVKSSSGQNQIPAYITILCSSNDILNIEDAKKIGSFDFYKYPIGSLSPSKVTYVPSWNQTEQPEQVPATGTSVATPVQK